MHKSMKRLYRKFFDWLDDDPTHLKGFIILVIVPILLLMFLLDKFGVNISGRGGNPQESYQENLSDY